MSDSPRYCMFCETWGTHHTDRCPVEPDRDAKLAEAERRTQAEMRRIQQEWREQAEAAGSNDV